ncbi:ion channel [Lithospermum erythrorhizon]|uniref:Ion channel n=1 Tax=Lithospermum erythrorhizon TaxID=34254 RepID=A0AAV3PIB2_LITER
MEEAPLLAEESGGATSSGSSNPFKKVRNIQRGFLSAIATGSSYEKAAALVDLAEDGVGLPQEILELPSFEYVTKLYFTFCKYDFFWSLNFFALIILNFFEKPLWCSKYSVDSCSDRAYYFLGELPYLTDVGSLIYEGITLVILIIHTFFPLAYEGGSIFWKNILNKLKVILLVLLVADLIVYVIYLSPVALYMLPFRIAPYIRVVLFMLNIRELRDSMVVLAGMLRTYLNILALFLLFLLFASWLAYVIFEDTLQGQIVFTSYGTTLYEMFVLFTTSNNPDVWIPAYKVSRWYCLFFVLYMLLGVYFVTNLILAVVYDSFKSQLAKQIQSQDNIRMEILKKAFDLIVDNDCDSLNEKQCIRLFKELNNYRSLPNMSEEDYHLIFDELDDSRDFKITLEEFADLTKAIALKFQKEDTPSLFENCPNFYHSPASEKLKTFVRSPPFGYIGAFVLIVNLVAVIIETTLDITDSSEQNIWQEVEFAFGWIYVLEMVLKVYTYGFANYWKDGHNRFDFLVTWIIVIGETTTFAAPNSLTFLANGEWIRYLLIARMLRLIRLLMHVEGYRAFVSTFFTLIPSLMPYLGIIFCVMCIYCSLGLQLFGGIVNAGNINLDGTDLSEDDYLLFNFNDYANGMVTVFNLLVMNNWQDWMKSYTDLTGTSWTLVYFISFYIITVLLLLNLVMAFVLEAFFAERDIEEAGNVLDKDGKKVRLAGSKTRSARVDALLHHILSSELEKVQPAPGP